MRRLSALLAAGVLVLLGASVAHADGFEAPGARSDEATSSASPRTLVIELGHQPTGDVEVKLVDADSGLERPFTGSAPQRDGVRVTAFPPALEAGSYVLTWTYPTALGSVVGTRIIHVGQPSAEAVGVGERFAPLAPLAGALLVLAGALAVGLRVVLYTRRRSALSAVPVLVAVAAAALAFPQGGLLALVVALLAVLALTGGALLRPRTGLLMGGLAAGAAGGALLAWQGTLPLVWATLGAAGGAGAAVALGVLGGLAVAPARARVVIRREAWLVGSSLMAVPIGLTGLWLGREPAPAASQYDLIAVSGAAVAALVFLAVVAGLAVALLRGSLRPAAALAVSGGVALALLAGTIASAGGQTQVQALVSDPSGQAEECLQFEDSRVSASCLEHLYEAKAEAYGVISALQDLRTQFDAYPEMVRYCHEVTHSLGRKSLAIHRGDVVAAFSDGFDVCDFGYYHGIVEGAAIGMTDDEFSAQVPTLCAQVATLTAALENQCYHGMGHAVARRVNNDMDRGLAMCDAVRNHPSVPPNLVASAVNGCGTGVTMEWFSVAGTHGVENVRPLVGERKEVCLVIDAVWEPECIEYVGNTVDANKGIDGLLDIAQWCEANTDELFSCYRGLARAASGMGLGREETLQVCESASTTEARNECVYFWLFAESTTQDFELETVTRECAALPAEYRQGADSPCRKAYRDSRFVLSELDGKDMSFQGSS